MQNYGLQQPTRDVQKRYLISAEHTQIQQQKEYIKARSIGKWKYTG